MNLEKAFDHVEWRVLQAAALKLNFPAILLRQMITLYAAPRRLLMASGAVSQLIHPCKGILAGSTSATTELAATLHLTIANFAAKWPGLHKSLHVDDISLAGAHKTEDVFIQQMAEALSLIHI